MSELRKRGSQGTGLEFVRFGFRALSAAAPGLAERAAARLFATPRPSRRLIDPLVLGLKPERFDVDSGRYRLAAWSWGSGPTILLAHGWEGHAGHMTRFVGPLVAKGFRAVAFDMPAHGVSTGRSATIVDFARALGSMGGAVGPVHAIVAHSLGATATALALRDGLVARRVVLIAPAAEPRYFARGMAAFIGLPEARTEGMLGHIRQALGGDWDRLSVPAIAPSLRAQALILHDPCDAAVPWEHGKAIADSWPGARFEALEGLGHNRPLRDPRVVDNAARFASARACVASGRLTA